MTHDDQFTRTVRIAIPLQEKGTSKTPTAVPRRAGKSPKPRNWTIEQTTAQHDQRYEELLQSLYDGVLITEISGKIVDCNDRSIKLLLYDRQELSRMNITDLIAGADAELMEALRQNIDNQRFTLIEAYCTKKDGTVFPAEIATNRLVLTTQGHLCFFLRDITRRKKIEEELLETVSRLKELDSARARFVSNASHELRTPLTIISTYASMMFDGVTGAMSDQQNECLSTIMRNCTRLSGLIDDVLDLGRMESGREEFRRRSVNLLDLLRQCRHDFHPQFQTGNRNLQLEIPDQLPAVLCDHDKTAQVLTNLVGNALKHTDPGGNTTIRARHEPSDHRIIVEIQDDGPGISPEHHDRIFEAFTQVEVTENSGKGTGLGLAISKHIVEFQGGEIGVESIPQKGARFFFTLPEYTEAEAFDAFLHDRLLLLQGRGQKPGMVTMRLTASDDMPPETGIVAGLLPEALDVSEDRIFTFTSQPLIVVLKDKTAFNPESIRHDLAHNVIPRLTPGTALEFACLAPDMENTPASWLERALRELTLIATPPPAPEKPADAKKVLIVDDDLAILKIMQRLLQASRNDINIKTTTSGYEACILFGEIKPDLVILDLHLDDINGRRVFESMTQGQKRANMRTLVVSGFLGDINEMMALGCDDYLCKPFTPEDFEDKVSRLLGKS